MAERTILVTGATGMAGKAVVERLLQEGFAVRALVHHRGSPFPSHERLTTMKGDMRDETSLMQACEGVTGIVHLAACKNDEVQSEEVNALGAELLSATAKYHHVQWIIHVSTQSAKLARRGIYADTKLHAEQILNRCGIPVITLRSSMLYSSAEEGVLGKIVRLCRLPLIPVIGKGNTHIRPLHRNDLATLITKIAHSTPHENLTYDVGGPTSLSFDEFITSVRDRVGSRARLIHVPTNLVLPVTHLMHWCMHHPPLTVSNVLGMSEDVPMNLDPIEQEYSVHMQSWEEGLDQLFEAKEPISEEAKILLQYVASRWLKDFEPSAEMIERYGNAIHIHGVEKPLSRSVLHHRWKLHALDAAMRLWKPQGVLTRKLLIAAAIFECDPASALHLLPKDRSLPLVIWSVCKNGCSALFWMICGSLLLPFAHA